MAQQDRVNTGGVAAVGLIGTVLTTAIILGLQVMYHAMTDAERARKDSPSASPVLAAELTRQRARLTGYRVVDPAKGVVAIPIDRAMDLVVRERGPSGKAGEEPDGR